MTAVGQHFLRGSQPPDAGAAAEFGDRSAAHLLAKLGPDGCWSGHLSSSALATAVASFALASDGGRPEAGELARRGREWLIAHANADGGWGDTPDSPSNLSTTLLCWATLMARAAAAGAAAGAWLRERLGALEPAAIRAGVLAGYGEDRTFSVPILTLAALAGVLGPEPAAWRHIPQLPFEIALLPPQFLRAIRMPVVSYALPALIAMGLVRHRRGPAAPCALRLLREAIAGPALVKLGVLQPGNGGFLEATPLTAFVGMSLAGAGLAGHPATRLGMDFLVGAARPDGSWPIDTNLATWLTSLATAALAPRLTPAQAARVRSYLLGAQQRAAHPYTAAEPGGWAWTHLPGGVPDADDTAAALLALHALGRPDAGTIGAAFRGLRWLANLQNRDGGIPTFCRGWGGLPFDRSSPDLTAHAVRAWLVWLPLCPAPFAAELARRTRRALAYLALAQRADGTWLPLWFGNQAEPELANPVYGTAQVVRALGAAQAAGFLFGTDGRARLARAVRWLVAGRRAGGGWGGGGGASPPSVEETGLAVTALRAAPADAPPVAEAIRSGIAWLAEATGGGSVFPAAPIGLYFARLWYAEELYPAIWAATALAASAALPCCSRV